MYKTERLTLQAVQEKDVDIFFRLLDDYDTNAGIEAAGNTLAPPTREDIKKFVLDGGNSYTVLDEVSRVIGFGQLTMNFCARIAYPLLFLAPDHQGKGYGRELIMELNRIAFHEVNALKSSLTVYEFNDRARRLYMGVGYQEEGRRKKEIYRDGTYWDVIYMGLFRKDWKFKE